MPVRIAENEPKLRECSTTRVPCHSLECAQQQLARVVGAAVDDKDGLQFALDLTGDRPTASTSASIEPAFL